MSGNLYGADIEALRQLADRINRGGQTLDGVVGIVESVMPDPGQWSGPDADIFRDEWYGSHAPSIAATAQALIEVAGTARRNADEQDATSESLGGGGGVAGGGFPGSPGSGSVTADGGLDLWPDWLNNFSSVASWAAIGVGTMDNLAAPLLDDAARMAASLSDDAARFANLADGIGTASRALGGLGVGLGLVQIADGIWGDGGGYGISDGFINTGLAAAGLVFAAGTPVGWAVLGASAVWAGAGLLANHLGYDSTSEMFVDAGQWVGNTVADAAGAAWDGVSDAAGAAWDGVSDAAGAAWDGVENAAGAVADAGEAIADGAGALVDTIGGWF